MMKVVAIFALLLSAVAAFSPSAPSASRVALSQSSTALSAVSDDRRQFLSAAAGVLAAGLVATAPALAIRDYADVGLLGGSDIIDINNANVRAYIRLPGMYPSAAGKIASHGPYSSVSEVYNIKGLTAAEKDVIKKYESRFVAKKPSADFVIDRINNGLYR